LQRGRSSRGVWDGHALLRSTGSSRASTLAWAGAGDEDEDEVMEHEEKEDEDAAELAAAAAKAAVKKGKGKGKAQATSVARFDSDGEGEGDSGDESDGYGDDGLSWAAVMQSVAAVDAGAAKGKTSKPKVAEKKVKAEPKAKAAPKAKAEPKAKAAKRKAEPEVCSDESVANRNVLGFRVGDRSRGRFATPADFPRHDCSPNRGLHVRRERLAFVHRPRTVFCRAV
jgi:hypothetical protein